MLERDDTVEIPALPDRTETGNALGAAEDEEPTQPQPGAGVLDHPALGRGVEVDQHVPQENHVAERDVDRRQRQVALAEPNQLPDLRFDLPVRPRSLKVLVQMAFRASSDRTTVEP